MIGNLSRFVLVVGLMQAASCSAVEIYRWIDGEGRTHVSDTVPDKYRLAATRTDSKQFELSAGQKREAELRKASLLTSVSQQEAPKPAGASAPSSSNSSPSTGRQFTERENCASQLKAYQAAEDCFAPYKLANGATRPEAFTHCKVVTHPNCSP